MRRGRTGGTAGRRRGEVGGVGPCTARAEGGLQKMEADAGKKEILGHSREEGMQREGIASAAFWVLSFIISLAGTWRDVTGMRWICFTGAHSFNIL